MSTAKHNKNTLFVYLQAWHSLKKKNKFSFVWKKVCTVYSIHAFACNSNIFRVHNETTEQYRIEYWLDNTKHIQFINKMFLLDAIKANIWVVPSRS